MNIGRQDNHINYLFIYVKIGTMPPRAWKYWTSACFDHVKEKYNHQEQKIQKYFFCHLVELLNEGLVLDRVEVRGPLGQPGPTIM